MTSSLALLPGLSTDIVLSLQPQGKGMISRKKNVFEQGS
jgi:hypothetical protein